jgi:hypothetical protein
VRWRELLECITWRTWADARRGRTLLDGGLRVAIGLPMPALSLLMDGDSMGPGGSLAL